MSVDPTIDKIEFKKEFVQEQDKLVYYKLNKPR
jgi:hypothetical protein